MGEWIKKMRYTHTHWNTIHLSKNKGQNVAICNNMDGCGGHYVKWKKSKIFTARPHFYVGFKKFNIKLRDSENNPGAAEGEGGKECEAKMYQLPVTFISIYKIKLIYLSHGDIMYNIVRTVNLKAAKLFIRKNNNAK